MSYSLERRVILLNDTGFINSAPEPKPLDFPPSSTEPKVFSPKIQSLVDDISKLNLLEVADLNECLKVSLTRVNNHPDLILVYIFSTENS